MIHRLHWWADLKQGKDEPLILSLVKYRMREDREVVPRGGIPNLVSSHLEDSHLHAPILDLDIPHRYVTSTNDGHGHLYIDVPMSRFRMFVMLAGLRFAGVIEMGNFWWSLRRGATFVRPGWVEKKPDENLTYSYGMFFKIRRQKIEDGSE